MAIIGPLPAQLLAGQPVSAAPVMLDFNWIVSQVNANVPTAIPLSRVMVRCSGSANFISTVPIVIGNVANVGITTTVPLDSLGEFDINGVFTAASSGIYQILVNAILLPFTSTLTSEPQLNCLLNGTACAEKVFFANVTSTANTMVASNLATVTMAAGDTLRAEILVIYTGFVPTFQFANLSIVGLG